MQSKQKERTKEAKKFITHIQSKSEKKTEKKTLKEQFLNGCVSRNLNEVDGREFRFSTLKEFVHFLSVLKSDYNYKQIHLNYFDNEKDLDLWLEVRE